MPILITDLLRKVEPGTEHDGLLPPIKTRARSSAVSEGSGTRRGRPKHHALGRPKPLAVDLASAQSIADSVRSRAAAMFEFQLSQVASVEVRLQAERA